MTHEPYADGDCGACHEGANHVVSDERELCFDCHPGMGEDVKTMGLHQPLNGDKPCTVCHEPHTAPQGKLLPVERDRLCGSCHDTIQEQLSTATYSHPAQSTGTCSICHDPHFASEEGTFSLAERRCAACHPFQDHVMHPMGPDIPDPRAEGPLGCASCHDPHGSEHEYSLQDDPNGPLCVACHTDKIRTRQ
jgi:predicted CXXCH cytochrome family protein